jgi:hypothetical protein
MRSPKDPTHNALVLLLCLAAPALTRAQSRGQADMAIQGYYLGGNAQPLIDTSGVAFHFQTILPSFGYLSGSLEGYGSQNRLRIGENFLELRGAPWLGQRWTISGGDFRTSAALVEFPLSNLFTPEITARGVKIEAVHENTRYTFYFGEETLTAGPRIPYRILAPQTVMGASTVRKLARNWWMGGRFLQLRSSPSGIADNPFLFPPGRDIGRVRTFSVQSLYAPVKFLKFYAEVSRSLSVESRNLVSGVAGAALETKALTLRANYVREGALYFPLVGYFAGDRQGPFAEMRFRPRKGIELYGTANRYRNNLERNPDVPLLATTGVSAGLTAALPGKFSAMGQYSVIRFSSQQAGEDAVATHNRQITASLARSIGRHSLHVTWRDIVLDQSSGPQRQRATEAEDVFHVKRMFFGGAARYQQSSGSERRNSMYYRASAQGQAGPLTAFANVEIGNDVANQTIFSTNTYSTTVVGIGLKLSRNWSLQTEAFRNRLNMDLNPESIFVLQGGGVPIAQDLAALAQWSFLFRLVRQMHWGGGLPFEDLDHFTAEAAPLVGTVDGVVLIKALKAPAPAAGIPVSLDGHRVSTTTADGHYRFTDVPEGAHDVALALDRLPADFDPAEPAKTRLLVQPRRIAHADFKVLPLVTLEGQVAGPKEGLEAILIRLVPGGRYTTTSPDGRFAFYNVHEGDYELVLDPTSLPENAKLQSEGSVPVVVRLGAPLPPIAFSFTVTTPSKPVRTVVIKK